MKRSRRLTGILFAIMLVTTGWAAEIPAPVVRYTFDAPFGFEEPNAVGTAYPAIVPRNSYQQAAPRREPGLFGNALRRADRRPVLATFPAKADFTVTFWFKTDGPRADSLLDCGDLRFYIHRHKDILQVNMGGASVSGEYKHAAWNCAVLAFTGSRMSLYLNGECVGEKDAAPAEELHGQKLTFANNYGAHGNFNGLVDEFRVYDTALPPEQVAMVSDAAMALDTVPPVADAGTDHTVYLSSDEGITVPLQGRVAGGEATTVTWSVVGQPRDAKVILKDAGALAATASFTKPGDYDLVLTIDSQRGKSVDMTRVVVFPPHPQRGPAKLYPNPEKAGTHITSYTNMGDDKTPAPYEADFVEKHFRAREPKLQSKGFARERFKAPPPPYVHPRVFFNPEDLPAMRHRIKYNKAASAAYAKVSRMYEMMTRSGGVPADYFSPGGKEGRGSWHGGAGAAYCIGSFKALVEGDTVLARKLIDGAVRIADAQLAALDTLKTPEDKRNWQNIKHGILARYTTSYVYDFLYPWMTKAEQDKLRLVISRCTAGVHSIGMFSVPNGVAASNWVCWVTGDLLANILAIEGEDGFDPVVYREALAAMTKFWKFGILPDGSSSEGMGKNSITGQNLVAAAKRGHYAIASENIYNFYARFQLNVMQPYGNLFISDDLWGSSYASGRPPDAAVMKYAFPDDPVIDFVYRNVVKGERYETPLFKTTYGYNSALNNCWFGEEWTGSDDWNAHAAQALKRQPLDAHFNYSNIATARSAWDQDAAFLYFLPRMLGGHPSPARGTFVFSALGRHWSVYPTGHNHRHTLQHSVITVDGKSVGARWARMIAYESKKDGMIAAADLRDYYGNRGDANRSQNDHRVRPAPEPWCDLPGWQMPHWYAGNRPGRGEAPAADVRPPADAAYRVAAFVRAEKPYAVILDEMDIDGLTHDYRWQMVLPADLHGQVTIQGSDAVITDPATGNFVLVRPISSSAEFTATCEATEWARGVVAFETSCLAWEFAVLLMPFRKGETPPPGTDIPGLDETLKRMTATLEPEKKRLVREAKARRDKVLKELDGFTPVSLGDPSPIEIAGESLGRAKGIVGQAYVFNGEESLVVPAGLPPFDAETPFTVAFWAKASENVGTLYNNSGNRGLCLAAFQGRSLKVSANGNWYWASPSLQLADWCHLAVTYDGTTLALYQNGALVKASERTGRMESARGGTTMGSGFKGWIDDLRVYPHAISADEVSNLYKYQRYLQGK